MAQAASGYLITPAFAAQTWKIQLPCAIRLEGLARPAANQMEQVSQLVQCVVKKGSLKKGEDAAWKLIVLTDKKLDLQRMRECADPRVSPDEAMCRFLAPWTDQERNEMATCWRTAIGLSRAVAENKRTLSELKTALGVRKIATIPPQAQ
jgi:hypothetical protein